jgi:predicted nucleic acid-binding protein
VSALRVVDASVVAAWILPDEDNEAAERWIAYGAGQSLVAPFHFPAEMANVILVAVRRRRLTELQAALFRQKIASLDLEIDDVGQTSLEFATPLLAQTHGLTIYDALYLELAIRLNLPLATFDRDLRRAAEAEGVRMA